MEGGGGENVVGGEWFVEEVYYGFCDWGCKELVGMFLVVGGVWFWVGKVDGIGRSWGVGIGVYVGVKSGFM